MRASRAGIVALVGLALAVPANAAALTSVADAGSWVTDGAVLAVAHGAGRTFIGGSFTHVGPRTGGGVPIGANGAVAGPFPEVVGGNVYATAADGSGGWFVGGDFTSIGGVSYANFAHIKADGSVDPVYDAKVNGTVRAIAVSDAAPDTGVVYLGGDFKQVKNQGRDYAAALATDGSLTSWNPKPDNRVQALAETHVTLFENAGGDPSQQPIVFVGGDFTNIGANPSAPSPALKFAGAIWGVRATQPGCAPDSTESACTANPISKGWALTGFNNFGLPTTGTGVRALAVGPVVDNGDNQFVPVYLGGDFGTSPTAGLVAAVLQIAQPPASGLRAAGVKKYGATWNGVGCATTDTNCSPIVRALALDGDTLYVGGDFTLAKNTTTPRTRLAAMSVISDPTLASQTATVSDSWSDTGPVANGPVRSLVADTHGTASAADDTLYAAGDFDHIGTAERSGLAGIGITGQETAWNPRAAGGKGYVVAVGGGKVYAGGSFTSLGAQPVAHLAALDANGVLDPAWAAAADDGTVSALALSADESTLYIGGGFTHVSAKDRNHIAAVDAATGKLQDGFKPSLDGWALAIEPVGDRVYVGGTLSKHAAAYSAADGSVVPWDPGVDDTVRAIDVVCGTVYLGGRFDTVGGQDRPRIAAVRASDAGVTDWAPGDLGVVHAIIHDGSSLYVGGDFLTMGSQIRRGLAKIDLNSGTTTDWSPMPGGSPIVRALALSPDGSTLYAAGEFVTMDSQPRQRLAAVDTTTGEVTAADSWDPSLDDRAFALATSGGAVYVGGEFRQTKTAMQQGFASFNAAGAATGPAPAVPCPGDQPAAAPPPPPAPITPSDTPAPVHKVLPALNVKHFRLAPPRFRVNRPGTSRTAIGNHHFKFGSAFVFRITRRANVKITIHRELFGRRKGSDCKLGAQRKRGRRCTLYQRYGTLRLRDVKAGKNSVAFSGMFGKKSLPPGVYTAKLVATVDHGKQTVSRLARFQVIRS